MDPNLRPTPETDAALAERNSSVAVDADFARRLERERDEAREIAKKYEDRYFTMSELRNNASIVALEYKSQRDRLLGALKALIDAPDHRKLSEFSPEELAAWAEARDAIAEVKGAS